MTGRANRAAPAVISAPSLEDWLKQTKQGAYAEKPRKKRGDPLPLPDLSGFDWAPYPPPGEFDGRLEILPFMWRPQQTGIGPENKRKLDVMVEAICAARGATVEEAWDTKRGAHPLIQARVRCMYEAAGRFPQITLSALGRYFKNRHHTTIRNGVFKEMTRLGQPIEWTRQARYRTDNAY